ncbi:hypothetical protein ACQEVC_45640 [Plantactinospora sp. CA-294935]|uniref:hypothetical protein n=1 Tax=Plantactinospora sp. CA-294935 TaxID=3240012 RepID=UPI003D8E6980
MTDVAIRSDQQLDIPAGTEPAAVQLAQWAQAADAAYRLAQSLCGTQFSPAAYRGKPEEACAAILAGAEVRLSPMASLRAFDNIQGTPAPKAITLRAIVQSLGHRVEVVGEPTAQTASVRGLRKGETDWQVSTWTIERAQQMGLTTKDQWKKQPAAMLVARATAEVCRWIASDAIMGMPYTAEEIRDEGGSLEARPAPQRITAAEILGTTSEEPKPAAVSYLVDPDCLVEPEDITPERVLDWIASAATQDTLDVIKRACQEHNIRDQHVLDAWTARSAELAKETQS